jgi:hypothetical protein
MNKPEYIIIHHSLTKDRKVVDWQAIRKYHMDKGWNNVGYHYGIELVNEIPEILIGRFENQAGAHCKQQGMNRKSLGVMICGNFDEEHPIESVWIRALQLVRFLKFDYEISSSKIVGHNYFADYKSCPGTKFDMDKFRDEL